MKTKIIIAGPCAAESKEQIDKAIQAIRKRTTVHFMRVSLWKPRTKPGFDGLAEGGIDLLVHAAASGVNPATEVLVPENAKMIMDKLFKKVPKAHLMVWIGARNQNHYIQREIARVAASDERVYLMIKNQPWVSEEHWEGMIGHVLEGGIRRDRLILCHRGFTPHGPNPEGYRNVPDFEMSMRIKEKTNLPIVFDPSHTGGSVPNVFKIAKAASHYDFDGFVVEVHHDPKNALTDAKQQLTWEEFDTLIKESNKK